MQGGRGTGMRGQRGKHEEGRDGGWEGEVRIQLGLRGVPWKLTIK